MRQLLDTHTFIWFIMGDPRITGNMRSQIEMNENIFSIISFWEIAIKHSIGKLNLNSSFAENIPVLSADAIFDTYPIQRLW
ncbi:type II toxin-antitoxin system VapC family toxin [Anabaena minutissima FACHB-250]|nr:type II toxin-antitoxin system VapC family toxin [Anabaena minutissima FACHB-250]